MLNSSIRITIELTEEEEIMEANVGQTDKIVRIVAGLALLSLTVIGPKTMLGLIGIVPLATAFINFCPAYKLLGISTVGK